MHNRPQERSQLKRKLEAGLSIHMPAPRRIGKTWTIGHLATDLRADGWHVIEIDVEGKRTPQEFARELCMRIEAQQPIRDRFKTHAVQRLNALLGGKWGDKPLDAVGKVEPIDFAETLIASLDEAAEKTAIIIDEISFFFLALAEADAKEAHTFAYNLRALQQRYRKVRWLITGSIGLHTIARRYGLEGAFVDFETFVLEPFTADEALSYMRDPIIQQRFNQSFNASDADFRVIFAKLGWLAPFYLNLLANEVRPSIAGAVGAYSTATLADLEAAFEKLLQPNRRFDFAVWREHLEKNLPQSEHAIAKQVLNHLSRNQEGETDNTLLAKISQSNKATTKSQLREVLAMLVNDAFIIKANARYAFRSGLVRQYWQEHEAD
jgi:uncharacterized protein